MKLVLNVSMLFVAVVSGNVIASVNVSSVSNNNDDVNTVLFVGISAGVVVVIVVALVFGIIFFKRRYYLYTLRLSKLHHNKIHLCICFVI